MHVDLMRDAGADMPSVSPNVESLRIWHCRYRTLKPLGSLQKLRFLVIASYPDDSLDLLRPLADLRHLHILHLPRVRDLSPLAHLQRLEALSLETLPSWDASGKVTVVESLEPLARLPQLKHLALFGVVPKGKSLAALERCQKLLSARFSKYSNTEVDRFYEVTRVSDEHVPEPEVG